MDKEKIFQIICRILDKLYCSETKTTLREFYFQGQEISLETEINFNFQDSSNFFQKISNLKKFSFGAHAFIEFQEKNKTFTIKEVVDRIHQLTNDPIFINGRSNWLKWSKNFKNKEKKLVIELTIENEFNELLNLDFAY